MLTSYMVKCPHVGCRWFGSLLPRNDVDSWRGQPSKSLVLVFECPRCHEEWRARLVGDDVAPLPHEEVGVPSA
jgi:hypothetical protein